ncbi:MAG: hypothetical protein ABF887_03690, partial [Gluconobacter oxydans]
MTSGFVRRPAALLIGIAALSCGSAYAQTIQEAEPTYDASVRVAKPLPATPLSGPVVPPFENPPAFLPDFFGVRAWLRAHGIALLVSNTNEFTGAVTKPTPGFRNYRQGASNAGQVSTVLHMNADGPSHALSPAPDRTVRL